MIPAEQDFCGSALKHPESPWQQPLRAPRCRRGPCSFTRLCESEAVTQLFLCAHFCREPRCHRLMPLTPCTEPLLCVRLSAEVWGSGDAPNRVSASKSLTLRAAVRKLILRRARSETLWLCGPCSRRQDAQPFQAPRRSPGAVGPSPSRGPGVGWPVGPGSLAVGLGVLLSLFPCVLGPEGGWHFGPRLPGLGLWGHWAVAGTRR